MPAKKTTDFKQKIESYIELCLMDSRLPLLDLNPLFQDCPQFVFEMPQNPSKSWLLNCDTVTNLL